MSYRPRLLFLAAALGVAVPFVGTAHADITRCVGATGVEGAHACYTSPRFDHIGLVRSQVATVPVVCYGLGCTSAELTIFEPAETYSGRFIAVTYLGNTYTVYRPNEGQPFVVKSNAGSLRPTEDVQTLLIAVALDASKQ